MGSGRGIWPAVGLAAALGAGLAAAAWLALSAGDDAAAPAPMEERSSPPLRQSAPSNATTPEQRPSRKSEEANRSTERTTTAVDMAPIATSGEEFQGAIRLSDALGDMEESRRISLIDFAKRSLGRRLAMEPMMVDEAVIRPLVVEGELTEGEASETDPSLRRAVRERLTVFEVALIGAPESVAGTVVPSSLLLVEDPQQSGRWLEFSAPPTADAESPDR